MSTDTILPSNNEINQMYKADGVGLSAVDKNIVHLIEPYWVGRMTTKAGILKRPSAKDGVWRKDDIWRLLSISTLIYANLPDWLVHSCPWAERHATLQISGPTTCRGEMDRLWYYTWAHVKKACMPILPIIFVVRALGIYIHFMLVWTLESETWLKVPCKCYTSIFSI